MAQTMNPLVLGETVLDEKEKDQPRKKKIAIFLIIFLVFAGVVAIAVLTQKSPPQATAETSQTSAVAESVPPPAEVPVNPVAGAEPQLVPQAVAAPPTLEKSLPATPTPAPVPSRRAKKSVKHERSAAAEPAPAPSPALAPAPAPTIAPPQLAPVPMTAPVAPAPIPNSTSAPATSTTPPPDVPPPPA